MLLDVNLILLLPVKLALNQSFCVLGGNISREDLDSLRVKVAMAEIELLHVSEPLYQLLENDTGC